jgi:hypothetical protein
MTADLDRCRVLEMLGYTARQAQFLVRVALHGGYFLRRQYVTFTGTRHGQATVRFLARCVAREHVRVLPYGRDGHVFHLSAARCTRRSAKKTIVTVVPRNGTPSSAS